MSYTHIAAYKLPPSVSLGLAPALSASAVVRNCRFGRYTQVGEQTRMEDSNSLESLATACSAPFCLPKQTDFA